MPSLFLPKHQKLILQCYPPGKGTEKKPNSSELSYLLYYASTRRVKLEKVITFLNKKTGSDTNRNRTGNVQVTLIIVSSLIEKCTDNLNVFAKQAVSILDMASKSPDIGLFKSILDTYTVLCKNLDSGLFAGDKDFVSTFVKFSERLINLGYDNSKKKGPNSLEWKMISLLTIKSLSYCLGNIPEISKSMMSKTLPILINTFSEFDGENLLHRNFSNDGLESVKLSKIQSSKTLKAERQIEEDLENDIVDSEDLYQESISGLKSVFNTPSTTQISEATDCVVAYTAKNESFAGSWSQKFVELCTTWVPVQLRFVVLTTLVAKSKQFTSKQTVGLQKHYASHILGLVSSKVNMIGLSISDLIQYLLDLKLVVFFEQADHLDSSDTKELCDVYSKSIVNLSTHIYYYDQVPDSIYEIFIKIESTLEYSQNKRKADYVMTLLEDIQEILISLEDQSSSIVRNHVGIEQWQISLPLIAQKHSVNIYKSLTQDEVDGIQKLYLDIFVPFLQRELSTINNNSQSDEIQVVDNLSDPDFNSLISESTNFLSHFLVYLDKYLTNNDAINFKITRRLVQVSELLGDIFGVNFLNNFVPFYFHWTLDDFETEPSPKLLARDTFAQALFKACLEVVDTKYPGELGGYSAGSTLYRDVVDGINYRVDNGVWVQEIVEVSTENSGSLATISPKEVRQYSEANPFLSKWVNAQRPLILSILHDDVLGHPNGNGTIKNGNGHSNGNINGNGHVNGDIDGDITTDSSSEYAEVRPGLGLGTVADIVSIHSGLRNTTMPSTLAANNSYDYTNGSIWTNDKLKPPKVSDLKGMLNEYSKQPVRNDSNHTTPGSVLSKQMATHDVDSILEGLDDDDEIIV